MRTLLIDADILAYKFASRAQREYEFGTAVDELDTVTPLMDQWLTDLQVQQKADHIHICLSCPTDEGWRRGILPSYKGNRKDVVKPALLQPLKEYLADNYPSELWDTLEADDVMGILSTHPTLMPGQKVIVSEDKDMKTIPGWLLNPEKDFKPRLISEEEADYWHLYQAIVGDATDGYKGCPKAGPVAATEALMDGYDLRHYPLETMWARVVALFTSKGLTEADALVQARVARICRASDYDVLREKVILWTPPVNLESSSESE